MDEIVAECILCDRRNVIEHDDYVDAETGDPIYHDSGVYMYVCPACVDARVEVEGG